jgi:hypothetical protein
LFSPNIATAHYFMAIAFLVLLTVGEIIWSPKLSEYTAASPRRDRKAHT